MLQLASRDYQDNLLLAFNPGLALTAAFEQPGPVGQPFVKTAVYSPCKRVPTQNLPSERDLNP